MELDFGGDIADPKIMVWKFRHEDIKGFDSVFDRFEAFDDVDILEWIFLATEVVLNFHSGDDGVRSRSNPVSALTANSAVSSKRLSSGRER